MASNEQEQAILQRQLHGLASEQTERRNLLKYSTLLDKVILSISFLCAILGGVLNPIISVIYGQTVGIFGDYTKSTIPSSDAHQQLVTYSLYWVYLSVAIFVLIYVATVGFYYVGERTARALRNAYLKAIIRQNMAFFDVHETGQVSARIMSDMTHIQEGITSKVSIALTAISSFASSFIIALIVHWKTALVLSPVFVMMVVVNTLCGPRIVKYHQKAKVANEKASGLAQEAISSIRHVYALGIQHHLMGKYEDFLKIAGQPNRRALYVVAIIIAWSNTVPILIHALTFWAGSQFLVQGTASVAQITTIALVVVIGAFAIVRIAPAAQALAATVSSTNVVLNEMARRSPQDPFDMSGEIVNNFQGDIELRGVSLRYPQRPDSQVLQDVSFTCPSMKTTAIVGASGSGKSSIINLLERFYEPTGGEIYMDNVDIQKLNLHWLRCQMGLVRQQPVLFDTTIFENIRYGLIGSSSTQLSGETLDQKITSAAKIANAHEFIESLPDGYQTIVGENAIQLSGGQKQRIAIARALIKDPRVLLLDEATSALDATSESAVQTALNKAAKDRTTIIIAHRLSTIRHADTIVVISKGLVVEQGTHDDLIALDGHYARQVRAQQVASRERGEDGDMDIESVEKPVADNSHDDKTILDDFGARLQLGNDPAERSESQDKINKPKTWGLGNTLALIVRLTTKKRWLLYLGLLCSLLAGLELPGRSVVFAKTLEALSLAPSEYGTLRNQVNILAGIFLALAFATCILWLGVGYSFGYATETLSQGVRDGCFRSIMAQDVEFFDTRSTGALLSILTTSADSLIGLGGPVIGGALTFICTIFGGIILSVALGWKLALVCTATIPLVVACGWIRLQMLAIFDANTRQNGIDAASYATEIVKSVGTVASLGLEDFVLERYDGFLAKQSEKSLRSILGASSLYAGSQSVVYLASALAFWYGGTLLLKSEYTLFQIYICYNALISGAQIAGSIFSFAPDASKAIHASWAINEMLEHKPARHSREHSHIGNEKKHGEGHIQFKNVSFSYPSRPGQLAIDNFSLTVGTGKFVALVGSSGCGKSTILSLIERFYTPSAGSVFVEGQDLSTIDVDKHRRSMSLVSQESMLFSTSIRENIAMGVPGQDVSDEAIWAVCRQANIDSFIASLQDGLSTFVGPGGSTLSGGQKQRIEIARALLRNPSILLLDEATSALDTESEALVQEALEFASRHRTTIAVAHRLSTIQKADLICVLDHGKLVESGTHQELVQKKGAYWELLKLQDLQ